MKNLLLLIASILLFNHAGAKDIKRELDSIVSMWAGQAKFSGTVVVTKYDKVLLNKGYGVTIANSGQAPIENTLYLIGESTEMFTAALVFKLKEEAKITLTDPVTKYLPELPQFNKVTITDLLTHRSGLHDYFTDPNLTGSVFVPQTRTAIMNIISGNPLRFEPGTSYYFSFSDYYLLGLIIERITKQNYHDAIRKYILQPAGIKDAGFDFGGLASWDKAQGYTILSNTRMIPAYAMDSTVGFAGAGMYTSANGMYKWAMAMLNNKILKKNSWIAMTNVLGNNFGHGWEAKDFFGKRAVGHNGEIPGFVNHFYVVPEDSTIIIIMSNDFESETVNIFDNITAALYNQPYTIPAPRLPVYLERKRLEFYVGVFEFEGTQMNLYINEGQIWAKIEGQPEFTMVADIVPDEFFMNGTDMQFKFVRDPKTNLVTHMILHHNRRDQKWKRVQ